MGDGSEDFISDDEIIAIKIRSEKATGGPWKSFIEGREEMSGSSFIMTQGDDIYLTGATDFDQDFIAAARSDIPKLIAEIMRIRGMKS